MGRKKFWSFMGMVCSAAVLGQEFAGIPEQEWNIAENAAAKMISMAQDMLDSLMNMTR